MVINRLDINNENILDQDDIVYQVLQVKIALIFFKTLFILITEEIYCLEADYIITSQMRIKKNKPEIEQQQKCKNI